jgi:hypothetical protein
MAVAPSYRPARRVVGLSVLPPPPPDGDDHGGDDDVVELKITGLI